MHDLVTREGENQFHFPHCPNVGSSYLKITPEDVVRERLRPCACILDTLSIEQRHQLSHTTHILPHNGGRHYFHQLLRELGYNARNVGT